MKVLFKKGDAKNPENYRPITLLRITYKLFSRMLCARIKKVLEQAQPVDQAGFRSGFGVEDHLFTMVMISELQEEFNLPLWICSIDYRKALDTVGHDSIWKALVQHGVPQVYVRTLAALYEGQTGKIIADVRTMKLREGPSRATQ